MFVERIRTTGIVSCSRKNVYPLESLIMAESSPNETPSADRGQIVVLNRDLFFGVRIGNLLKADGYEPTFVKTTQELIAALIARPSAPALVLVDIGANPDWEQLKSSFAGDRVQPPVL